MTTASAAERAFVWALLAALCVGCWLATLAAVVVAGQWIWEK